MWKLVATAALTAIAGPALADEREYCPARPGLGTPACTTAPGHVSVETGLIDWTVERDPAQRTDTILIGDTLVRIGLADSVEAQFGWTPYGHVRTRNGGAAPIDRIGRVGDVSVGMKANLAHPDGSGLSVAVQPFVTIPVGRTPVGAGDWGAGLVAPVTYDLSEAVNLQFTPEIDAAVDEDGRGRHFAYSGTIGLGVAISDAVNATVEFQALRDEDPAGGTTQTLAALSVAWMPNDDLQLDVGMAAGLNDDAPDAEVYVGVPGASSATEEARVANAGWAWKKQRGAMGQLAPLIGQWRSEPAGPGMASAAVCTRRFTPILGKSYVQLDARWDMGERGTYEELALFGKGGDALLEFHSFTNDGKKSHGTWVVAEDIHPDAIAFQAQMPAGLARFTYWPAEEGESIFFVVESKVKSGWNRFLHHRYRRIAD